MASRTGADGTRSLTEGADLGWDHNEKSSRQPRDLKRLFLVTGLGALSWVATFVGMLELIEANVGDLPFLHKIIIGFSVAMLMVMVVWLLDQIFSDISWATRLVYLGGYVFLTVISVGFGFGFYWKVLESRGESSRSAESAVGQVQTALHAGVTRLEQLQSTLDSLTQLSSEKAALERQSGTSCPGSRPGDGPRRALRDDDAGRFKFAADFVRGRVTAIKGELGGLNGDLAKVMSNDRSTVDAASGTRNDFMHGLNRRLDMTVTGFNAFRSDPQLKQIRSDLAERADRATFPDTKGGSFSCPDAQLGTALKGVVRAIDELPSLEKPKIAAVEGSEAVIEAFRRLSASMFGAFALKMPPSPEELRELQKKAVQSVEGASQTQARLNALSAEAGLSKRDYIPLAIALFVDLCLLLVSIKKRGSPLEQLVPKMRAAERGPVIQILSRFNEIHRDKEIRENFEVFRHVVFDFHGDYYAAVPLNAPYRPNVRNGRQMQGYGVTEAEALLQEAHLLANLFASFEKERIFTRVMSPLLTTSMIQRRLRRQGSKFAHAEAFRVYRFRDGAWSDIILGAVMGAARRVEAAQRRRRVEEDLFRERMPDLTSPAYPPAPPDGAGWVSGMTGPGQRGGAEAFGPRETARSHDHPARGGFTPRVVPGSGDSGGRRHANGNTAPPVRPLADVRPAEDAGRVEPFVPDAPAPEKVVPHPALGRPAPGATSRTRERDLQQPEAVQTAEVELAVAPLGPELSSSSAAEIPAASETKIVAAAQAEPTVTVAATRETVTYTLPVSEARIPASLFAGSGRLPAEAPEASALEPVGPASSAIPSAVPAAAATGLPAVIEPISAPDDFRSIALRFGPASREG